MFKNINLKFKKKATIFKKKNLSLNSNFYWKIILCGFFILVIIFCAFSFYIYLEVNKKVVNTENQINKTDFLSKESLDRVLNHFKDREKKSAEIIVLPSTIVDPSL